jgi:hypothetical protein
MWTGALCYQRAIAGRLDCAENRRLKDRSLAVQSSRSELVAKNRLRLIGQLPVVGHWRVSVMAHCAQDVVNSVTGGSSFR